MTIVPPKIEFTQWIHWDPDLPHKILSKCPQLREQAIFPGIYVWAVANKRPAKMSIENPCEEVVYVGEAKKRLAKRVQQFARSCFCGSKSHSGGQRCRKELARDGSLLLFLAILPIDIDEPGQPLEDLDHWFRPYLHHVERTVIWNYVRQWHSRPVCNRM